MLFTPLINSDCFSQTRKFSSSKLLSIPNSSTSDSDDELFEVPSLMPFQARHDGEASTDPDTVSNVEENFRNKKLAGSNKEINDRRVNEMTRFVATSKDNEKVNDWTRDEILELGSKFENAKSK